MKFPKLSKTEWTVKKSPISQNTYLASRWNPDTQEEWVSHETLEQMAMNPNGLNLSLFAVTIINIIRKNQGLEPVKETTQRLFGVPNANPNS